MILHYLSFVLMLISTILIPFCWVFFVPSVRKKLGFRIACACLYSSSNEQTASHTRQSSFSLPSCPNKMSSYTHANSTINLEDELSHSFLYCSTCRFTNHHISAMQQEFEDYPSCCLMFLFSQSDSRWVLRTLDISKQKSKYFTQIPNKTS